MRRLLAVLALALGIAGCAHSVAPQPSAAGPEPQSPIVGIVTSVDSSGLDQVHGFTLRDRSGRQFAFSLGQLENPADFPPGHLAEHQLTAEPVEVWFRDGPNGSRVVYRLGDAAASPTALPS